jgi:hypothetical protein
VAPVEAIGDAQDRSQNPDYTPFVLREITIPFVLALWVTFAVIACHQSNEETSVLIKPAQRFRQDSVM